MILTTSCTFSATIGYAPLTIIITDTTTSPDDPIRSRRWIWGEGSSTTSPTHTYNATGVYYASLQVTTASGATSTSTPTPIIVLTKPTTTKPAGLCDLRGIFCNII
ncbi:PKD domain-containing protein [Methanocorpusculum vombati]|uniref:PKD domain-containing protein n=1 Tax=Methanocorpusculum vombati TaxID=3002864 RepID=A0ABT4IKH2_9EURY|nr:PKD domain-containing protein [Methanocorpusculum vombati]MCZ9319560.1 PKD domain-containing protein [Methanocorpusculum sp.]MCZ0862250.1 PKD domain-containing protein [Methanocorpusculum vombati]MDE2519729.1 PKD domain-containing protein [Methanocorpusculum sp.]MDE2534490.1 PKD domain-containing protein [Methanocorpusculum sp.]MDE2546138.1 PKD domain-containing protein [Methanocorpusculum sp.]